MKHALAELERSLEILEHNHEIEPVENYAERKDDLEWGIEILEMAGSGEDDFNEPPPPVITAKDERYKSNPHLIVNYALIALVVAGAVYLVL